MQALLYEYGYLSACMVVQGNAGDAVRGYGLSALLGDSAAQASPHANPDCKHCLDAHVLAPQTNIAFLFYNDNFLSGELECSSSPGYGHARIDE